MTSFMRRVLLNKEVIAVYRDVSGFRDIVMKAAPAPAPTPPPPPPVTCSVALEKQHSHAACVLHQTFGCVDGAQPPGDDLLGRAELDEPAGEELQQLLRAGGIAPLELRKRPRVQLAKDHPIVLGFEPALK